MDIQRSGSTAPATVPSEYFFGEVSMVALVNPPAPARVRAASITFQPNARTAWHTHPLGQTLIITEGHGLAQVWGQPIVELHKGDVVWYPPNEKHWHGASQTTPMTHIAIQEALDGKSVDWMEHVSEEEYLAGK